MPDSNFEHLVCNDKLRDAKFLCKSLDFRQFRLSIGLALSFLEKRSILVIVWKKCGNLNLIHLVCASQMFGEE